MLQSGLPSLQEKLFTDALLELYTSPRFRLTPPAAERYLHGTHTGLAVTVERTGRGVECCRDRVSIVLTLLHSQCWPSAQLQRWCPLGVSQVFLKRASH